ncbi:hypothetical protein QE412_002390 [Microbacterium trichothecenolyticum]|uniref:Uncharacterized protein n=1 Tax=Microbacterium trichothecenolyticum TaxID=69370 RepID=A0ABU0TVX6_MICTR|nr:hypothetical protein [Microbacterium trichothecenolyticum]
MAVVASPAAVAPTALSVQNTPLGRVECGVSWTLDIRHRPPRNATPTAPSPLLSVQNTPLAPGRRGVSWTLNGASPHRHPGGAA